MIARFATGADRGRRDWPTVEGGSPDRPVRMGSVVVVDSDHRLAVAVCAALKRCGYRAVRVATPAEALASAEGDVVLLDAGVHGEGLPLCRQLRTDRRARIIVVTVPPGGPGRAAVMAAGADDWIPKPLALLDLHTSLQALVRRPRDRRMLAAGRLSIDIDREAAFIDDTVVRLTRKEFQVLLLLIRAEGAVVPRHRLVSEVWRSGLAADSRTVDVHVATLRAKLADVARLASVRGVGYRLLTPPAGRTNAADDQGRAC